MSVGQKMVSCGAPADVVPGRCPPSPTRNEEAVRDDRPQHDLLISDFMSSCHCMMFVPALEPSNREFTTFANCDPKV